MKSGSLSPKNKFRQELGRRGEDRAAAFLLAKGFEIIARNWRCHAGEIDLIAVKEGDIRFVEVKTRRTTAYGLPEEAITPTKLDRMRRTADTWLEEAKQSQKIESYQVDVLAICSLGTAEETITWIEQVL
jgi:putative endonuclease